MKMLLEDVVYDVPSEVLMAWVQCTPELRDELRDRWRDYVKQHVIGTPTADELAPLRKGFYDDNRDWYFDIMLRAMMDYRETVGAEFEDYRTDMTEQELREYAQKDDVGSLEKVIRQPVRIPITSED